MYEAIIIFDETYIHRIEANTLEIFKKKCKLYIENDAVHEIQVIKPETIGYFKSPFNIELL